MYAYFVGMLRHECTTAYVHVRKNSLICSVICVCTLSISFEGTSLDVLMACAHRSI
jgi:hypothetical protein